MKGLNLRLLRSGDEILIRLVEIPAKLQGEMLLRLVESYKEEIENGAILTVDRYRVRIRHIYDSYL